METQSELQAWQKDILNQMENFGIGNIFENENEIPLVEAQKKMLEKVLGGDFYIQDEKIRETLEAVLELGFYYERDKKILNLARESYLMGKNWIKRSYR
jgi:hypothetical protein